jgi:hypothetical protein
MVRHAWSDGWQRVSSAPALVAGVFAVTVLTALPLALSLRTALEAHLGASLMAGEAADGVNYDWWQEFTSQSSGIAATFTPSIIGFATTLDSVSGLLDRRVLITPIAAALAVYLSAWVFLSGGILDRYARRRRVDAGGFFAASGTFFFRFLRLGVAVGAVYWFLFVYVHEWLFAKWYVNATRDVAVEHVAFYWRLSMYAIFVALLAVTTTVIDYAKVRAVVEDRRSMCGAVIAALRFIIRNPGRVAALYAINVAMFLVVVALWALAAPGAGGSGPSIWVGLLAAQGYVAARLIVKLQAMAAETALFQRSLAHVGYVASPAIVSSEPPMVEAL